MDQLSSLFHSQIFLLAELLKMRFLAIARPNIMSLWPPKRCRRVRAWSSSPTLQSSPAHWRSRIKPPPASSWHSSTLAKPCPTCASSSSPPSHSPSYTPSPSHQRSPWKWIPRTLHYIKLLCAMMESKHSKSTTRHTLTVWSQELEYNNLSSPSRLKISKFLLHQILSLPV